MNTDKLFKQINFWLTVVLFGLVLFGLVAQYILLSPEGVTFIAIGAFVLFCLYKLVRITYKELKQ